MTESTNWTSTDPEPVTTGTVTKSVRPTPDPLKEGVAALQAAAEAARRRPEAEIDKVRYSLQPVIKEAAVLLEEFKTLDGIYGARLQEIAATVRRNDLRAYHGIDRALAQLDRSANDALRMLSSGLRVLGELPRRVRMLSAEEVATKKYLDFGRDVAALRDGPKRVRGAVEECERILKDVEAIVAKSRPTRRLVEPHDPTYDPAQRVQQTKAETSSWDVFPSPVENRGKGEPFSI